MALARYYIYQNAGSKDGNSRLLSLAKRKAKSLAKTDRDGFSYILDRKTGKTTRIKA